MDSVLYVYRCSECKRHGELRLPDDSHDGDASKCEYCFAPVILEWDGGVTFQVLDAQADQCNKKA